MPQKNGAVVFLFDFAAAMSLTAINQMIILIVPKCVLTGKPVYITLTLINPGSQSGLCASAGKQAFALLAARTKTDISPVFCATPLSDSVSKGREAERRSASLTAPDQKEEIWKKRLEN